jgi:hypothetical protein
MNEGQIDLSEMANRWPAAVVARDRIEEFTGGLITAGTMANIDSRGDGPPRFNMGPRKVGYPVKQLVSWLEARCQNPGAARPVRKAQ